VVTGPERAPLALATRPVGGNAFSPVTLPFTADSSSPSFIALLLGVDGTVSLGLRVEDGLMMSSGPLAGPLAPLTRIASAPWPDGAGAHLAVADDGMLVAAWGLMVGDHSVIRWAVRPPGEAWGPVQGTDPAHSVALGSFSVDRAGHALITYISYDSTFTDTIYAVSRDPGGEFGQPEQISGDGEELTWLPTSAIAADGAAVIAYGSSTKLTFVHRASASASWGTRDTLATPATSSRSIVLDDDGNFVLAYVIEGGWDGTPSRSVLLTGRADGTHGVPRDLGPATIPALAMAGDGTVTAVWATFGDAPPRRLFAMRRPAGGDWTVPEAIDDADDPTQLLGGQWPAATVAADATGDALVGWVAYSGAYRVRLFEAHAPEHGGGDGGGNGGSGGEHGGGGGHGQGDGGHQHEGPGPHGGSPAFPSRPRCVVPALRNHTLARAKIMLRRAHCALGRATTPRRLRHSRRLVVRRQSRPARTRASGNFKVNVTLGVRRS
jgi:hypothetical protein